MILLHLISYIIYTLWLTKCSHRITNYRVHEFVLFVRKFPCLSCDVESVDERQQVCCGFPRPWATFMNPQADKAEFLCTGTSCAYTAQHVWSGCHKMGMHGWMAPAGIQFQSRDKFFFEDFLSITLVTSKSLIRGAPYPLSLTIPTKIECFLFVLVQIRHVTLQADSLTSRRNCGNLGILIFLDHSGKSSGTCTPVTQQFPHSYIAPPYLRITPISHTLLHKQQWTSVYLLTQISFQLCSIMWYVRRASWHSPHQYINIIMHSSVLRGRDGSILRNRGWSGRFAPPSSRMTKIIVELLVM